MAKTPDSLPTDPDDLEPIPTQPIPRRTGIPKAHGGRDHAVDDLSASKHGSPTFPTANRRRVKNLEDLDEQADETALRERLQPQIKPTPRAEPTDREAAMEKPKVPHSEAEPVPRRSGKEKEEELRRKGGRPKTVRSTDFEPLAWESSKTTVDFPEPDEDGQMPPRARLGSFFNYVTDGLRAAWNRLNVIEMASVAAFLVVALIGLFVFRNLVHSGPQPQEKVQLQLASLDFPAKGEFLTLANIQAAWRAPKAAEIVRPNVLAVPEVNIQLASGNGYLRILYRDEDGKIRGDIVVQQVTNGSINGSGTFSAVCSEGYQNTMNLVECQAGRREPWTIEVFESRDYDMTIDDWGSLARFEMPSETKAKLN